MSQAKYPKVSVVIPSYNHGQFLPEAIQSVLSQSYPNIEIIVVDDGSTDDTSEVAGSFKEIEYVFQQNAGLSAARNKGIELSSGMFLVFLDADDWLYPDAISTNVSYLEQNPSWAFVSGFHDKVDEWKQIIHEDEQQEIKSDHYRHFLEGNFIGMHATVMYRSWVFKEFRFDTSLKACEDYDLYFKISRKYPVGCHSKKLAAYRIHDSNMSSDCSLMVDRALHVLDRQKLLLQNDAEVKAFSNGQKVWKEYYGGKILEKFSQTLKKTSHWPRAGELKFIAKTHPRKFISYSIRKSVFDVKEVLKGKLPDGILKKLNRRRMFHQYTPPVGKIDFGDFNRLKPFSDDFGFDRGGAIDRYYIEQFLSLHRESIHGRVLEIGDNEYTLKFGRQSVLQSDILHVDASNEKATIVGDITNVPQIPSGNFDCIILTQTLHLIYDYKKALETCYRILKPGGTLLLTVPGISQIDKGPWKEFWLWSFTDTVMRRIMRETFNGSSVDIETYGNVKVASSFLYGVGLVELDEKSLNFHDPHYQVIISVKAVKS